MGERLCCHYLMQLPWTSWYQQRNGLCFVNDALLFCFSLSGKKVRYCQAINTSDFSVASQYIYSVSLPAATGSLKTRTKSQHGSQKKKKKKISFYFNLDLTLPILAGSKARIFFPPPSLIPPPPLTLKLLLAFDVLPSIADRINYLGFILL